MGVGGPRGVAEAGVALQREAGCKTLRRSLRGVPHSGQGGLGSSGYF